MAFDRATLRTRARLLADQDASDFPTDAQYNLYLDDAKRDVWADLVLAGWPVNYTTESITATGASQYALAAGASVFAVRGVFRVDGTRRCPVPRMERHEVSSQAQYAAGYELYVDPSAGTVLRLYPAAATGSYEVDYLPEIAGFANDAALWNGPILTDRMIAIRAAADAMRKEGRKTDADGLMSEYGMLLARVQAAASWVDMRNAPKIRDVNRDVNQVGRAEFDFDIGRGSY